MQKPCVPLMMAGMLDKGITLAKNLNYDIKIITDTGHKEGVRMRDYGDFSNPESKKNALLVECGQHWAKSSEVVAIETMIRFLRTTSIMDKNFADDFIYKNKAINFQNQKAFSLVQTLLFLDFLRTYLLKLLSFHQKNLLIQVLNFFRLTKRLLKISLYFLPLVCLHKITFFL